VDVLLPAEIGLRSTHRLDERLGIEGERSLAGPVFVASIVADGLDKAYIK